jgi:hypothetical protein
MSLELDFGGPNHVRPICRFRRQILDQDLFRSDVRRRDDQHHFSISALRRRPSASGVCCSLDGITLADYFSRRALAYKKRSRDPRLEQGEFIVFSGAVATRSLAARAQQSGKLLTMVFGLGYAFSRTTFRNIVVDFVQRLGERGWIEGFGARRSLGDLSRRSRDRRTG